MHGPLKAAEFPYSHFCHQRHVVAATMKKDAKFTCQQLKDKGYSFSYLKGLYSQDELLDCCSASDFRSEEGYDVLRIVGSLDSPTVATTCRKMRKAGFSALEMFLAGIPYRVCRQAGYAREALASEGYQNRAFLEKYLGCFFSSNSIQQSDD